MRLLYHPHRDEISVQGLLHALADPVRLRIYASLLKDGCAKNCAAFINVGGVPLPKSTLSQHFRVLRECGLVHSERQGTEMQNRSRCEDLQRFKPMLLEILAASGKEGSEASAPPKAKRTR